MVNQLSLLGEEVKEHKGDKQVKTVISASRRTDMPAFFYEWLQAALDKEVVEVPNPMFSNKTYSVDLNPSKVHTIVLWSKNFKNVLVNPMHLEKYNLYFQYTINSYSKFLEPNVPDYNTTLKILEGLLKKYTPGQFNIRFDPIIISTGGETDPTPDVPERARLFVFERLCRDLKSLGMENCRVTTSYLAMYPQVKARLEKLGLDMVKLSEGGQIYFFERMAEMAQKYGIMLYSCASPILEKVSGIRKGHCIDGELLEKLFGGRVKKSKDNGQREACGCTYSKEIGIYSKSIDGMKCLHGCKYCYAV